MSNAEYIDEGGGETHQEDAEAEARKLGWAPRDRWRGKPEEFVEASEFLRRGREVLPIVRHQVDNARAENARLKQELAEAKADFDRRVRTTEKMTQRLLEQQRAQMVTEFEEKKRQAAENKDMATYDRVVRQEQQAYAKMADDAKAMESEKTPPHQPQNAQLPAEVQDWAKRNEWFFRDQALAREAEGIHIALSQEAPGLGLAENLDRVTETLKQRYPHKFGAQSSNGRDKGFSAVEGSTSMRGASNSRERGWKDLPSEARGACQSLIDSGRLKGDAKKVQENYARTYWEEYDD